MDLPTYTSIWRIEKRLYKLYDFRLPMPVPVGQIAVFAAITVPYVILLTILGLPFNHTLFWLYVLPPGVITWLATRPVLESKRLPELVISQVRYLGEPGTWCRMAPLQEKDDVVVIGKVWRRDAERLRSPAEAPALAPAASPPSRPRRRPARLRRRPRAKPPCRRLRLRGPGQPGSACHVPLRPGECPPRRSGGAVPPSGPLSPLVPQGRRLPRRPIRAGRDRPRRAAAPLRPAAESAGRHATRPAFPASAPGLPGRGQEGATRPPRSDDLAAGARPPAAARPPAVATWPVKDPHAPSSPSSLAAPAAPAWTPPGPPAPPARGEREMTAGPAGPAAAPPIPATGDPVPAAGDLFPVAGDAARLRGIRSRLPGMWFRLPGSRSRGSGCPGGESRFAGGGGHGRARPSRRARGGCACQAQAAPPEPPEPLTGPSTSPAGFFIGPVRPEGAELETAQPEAAEPASLRQLSPRWLRPGRPGCDRRA